MHCTYSSYHSELCLSLAVNEVMLMFKYFQQDDLLRSEFLHSNQQVRILNFDTCGPPEKKSARSQISKKPAVPGSKSFPHEPLHRNDIGPTQSSYIEKKKIIVVVQTLKFIITLSSYARHVRISPHRDRKCRCHLQRVRVAVSMYVRPLATLAESSCLS